ncbi:N-formylglutamate amidohydrolase [Arenibaculum sp.]|uniref:N-formylglutamate amidohydrolase n=1 Tax=Arenibaculum sp. TaxID=2865862 RepID=UPI002E0DA501|nr:N-formylglutamate amidohydrolase [Arenibaculum sp.]
MRPADPVPTASDPSCPSPLGPGDPPPVTVLNREGRAPVLVLCDHAANAVPARLGRLGLDEAAFGRHIAYDVGAAGVTRLLSRRFDAPAVLSGYSRLVVDINRAVDDPTWLPEISDGVVVPGNRGLGAAEVAARRQAIYDPYHAAVAAEIDRMLGEGRVPAIVSIHSFTPVMRGFERPWHLGVLWDRDPRLSVPLIEALRRDPRLVVGDNEPYTGRDTLGSTTDVHATRRGLPHVLVELRQDLVVTPAGEAEWAGILAGALSPLLDDPALYRVERY